MHLRGSCTVWCGGLLADDVKVNRAQQIDGVRLIAIVASLLQRVAVAGGACRVNIVDKLHGITGVVIAVTGRRRLDPDAAGVVIVAVAGRRRLNPYAAGVVTSVHISELTAAASVRHHCIGCAEAALVTIITFTATVSRRLQSR